MSLSQHPRALVTGSSSGIGQAIAQALLDQGWQVAGLDLVPPEWAHAAFSPHQVDLRDPAATARAVQAAGPVQALVHAAGVLRVGRLGSLTQEDSMLMWQLHVDAATRLANLVIPAMTQAGLGRVVLIGSRVSGGMPGRSQYAATKAALVALARSWAAETAAQGVTVNVIAPAATQTAMLTDPARAGATPKLPPLGRLIRPAEIAALACFLLSTDAAAITGQEIQICGGASLAM
ncbi:SDR family NAD(P)-dependent oxidoreductase [Hylemonella gracilis]|uniref:Short-chain dehydrogenase/reductase sdr n=1 Tax=Hylemonella gracilis ATCC 19624 TaxID=887062 RepID=F3KT55_9BURK|nr:SDR family oxidoreductase [Hylemonella gracilis]EGI77051.1 short-chain dehydrogenase/reductase sdr [Hylemonella gracilis ATCC 19624]